MIYLLLLTAFLLSGCIKRVTMEQHIHPILRPNYNHDLLYPEWEGPNTQKWRDPLEKTI